MNSLAFFVSRILFRLDAKGKENIPKTGGFILASNHVSYLDPIVVSAICPYQISFMARHDLFKIPIFGSFIRALGAFPIRRNFGDIASIKEALRRLRQAKGLLLFPEGSRSRGELGEKVEQGIGFIAVKSQVPVIPTFVNGSHKAFGRNARFIRPTKIRVHFGKPIYAEKSDFKGKYKEFTSRIMQEIKQLSQMNPALSTK